MPDESLEIHLFDVRKGDCILIKFPDGEIGIVDSARRYRKRNSPALRWLHDAKVSELAFVCLSHPHSDHMGGMIDLFRSAGIRVKQFWHTVDNVMLFMSKVNMGTTADFAVEMRDRFAQKHRRIVELFRAVYEAKGEGSLRIRRIEAKSDPLETIGGVRITALSPHDTFVEEFEALVREDVDAGILGSEKRVFNQMSAVLLLEYGSCKIVLGGDAVSGAWESIMASAPELVRTDLASNWQVVKVGHHGAADCYSPGMWARVLRPEAAALLVSGDGLLHPSEAFLGSCRAHDRVYCTRRSGYCTGHLLHPHARLALSRARPASAPRPEPCAGDIRVVVDSTGNWGVFPQLDGPEPGCH